MKELVETIAKALVDDPSQVIATEELEEETLLPGSSCRLP